MRILAVNSLAVNGALPLYVESKSVLYTQYSVKKCLVHFMKRLTRSPCFPRFGWDCLRHYEILAAGSLPFFAELTSLPVCIAAQLPRPLLLEAAMLSEHSRAQPRNPLQFDTRPRWGGRMKC